MCLRRAPGYLWNKDKPHSSKAWCTHVDGGVVEGFIIRRRVTHGAPRWIGQCFHIWNHFYRQKWSQSIFINFLQLLQRCFKMTNLKNARINILMKQLKPYFCTWKWTQQTDFCYLPHWFVRHLCRNTPTQSTGWPINYWYYMSSRTFTSNHNLKNGMLSLHIFFPTATKFYLSWWSKVNK